MTFIKNKYRILSIKAEELLRYDDPAKEIVEYPLSTIAKPKTEPYYEKFSVILDWSLDSEELQQAYPHFCRAAFAFEDANGTQYTLAVVNVDIVHSDADKPLSLKRRVAWLERLYRDGFYIDGKHYVRYKRSSGSSRQGKCLFIRRELLPRMEKWGECGLKRGNGDLASWEAYKALSLSALKSCIHIDPKGILVVEDKYSNFKDTVVAVSQRGDGVVAEEQEAEITNNIWDGESLLDESLFEGELADKHMLLLRNKFFKSCAFKTKVKQWMRDNRIQSVDQLRALGHYTLATTVDDIVMITTPSSLKFVKFVRGGMSEKALAAWAEHVTADFGVVKYDMCTRFFDGRMVQSSYQLLNTIQLSEEAAVELMRPQANLVTMVREDPAVLSYYFAYLNHRAGTKDEEENTEMTLYGRWEVLNELMRVNSRIVQTRLYDDFRTDVVENMREKLRLGKLLFRGTNATLMGNGAELLLAAVGKYDGASVLAKGHIRCTKFEHNETLLGARSPHITMGNLLLCTNDLSGDIWRYFDLGDNVVCVNAIGENIMHRLNGCDYDSDSMLLTNDAVLVERATAFYDAFKVPVCQIEADGCADMSLVELDLTTSINRIGEIVNLSQWLNSLLWDRYNRGATLESLAELYRDICILAVLSGLEIDKAKRHFPIATFAVLNGLRLKYKRSIVRKPYFAKLLLSGYANMKPAKGKRKAQPEQGDAAVQPILAEGEQPTQPNRQLLRRYHTTMDYLYFAVSKLCNYRKGKEKRKVFAPLSSLFVPKPDVPERNDYNRKDAILTLFDVYVSSVRRLRTQLRRADEDEQECVYQEISLCYEKYSNAIWGLIANENVLRLVLKELGRDGRTEWLFYAILLDMRNPFLMEMLEESAEKCPKLQEAAWGDIDILGFSFVKK